MASRGKVAALGCSASDFQDRLHRQPDTPHGEEEGPRGVEPVIWPANDMAREQVVHLIAREDGLCCSARDLGGDVNRRLGAADHRYPLTSLATLAVLRRDRACGSRGRASAFP